MGDIGSDTRLSLEYPENSYSRLARLLIHLCPELHLEPKKRGISDFRALDMTA